jgi:hypothetical protein
MKKLPYILIILVAVAGNAQYDGEYRKALDCLDNKNG